jgi:hypothetical protein
MGLADNAAENYNTSLETTSGDQQQSLGSPWSTSEKAE